MNEASHLIKSIADQVDELLQLFPAAVSMTALALIVGRQLARPDFDGKSIEKAIELHAAQIPKYVDELRQRRH